MDFNDTPEQAAFRASAADWLAANVPTKEETEGLNRLQVNTTGWQKDAVACCHDRSLIILSTASCPLSY